MEFIEGAARLRGNAKALDIWRIETKMEAGQMGTPGTVQRKAIRMQVHGSQSFNGVTLSRAWKMRFWSRRSWRRWKSAWEDHTERFKMCSITPCNSTQQMKRSLSRSWNLRGNNSELLKAYHWTQLQFSKNLTQIVAQTWRFKMAQRKPWQDPERHGRHGIKKEERRKDQGYERIHNLRAYEIFRKADCSLKLAQLALRFRHIKTTTTGQVNDAPERSGHSSKDLDSALPSKTPSESWFIWCYEMLRVDSSRFKSIQSIQTPFAAGLQASKLLCQPAKRFGLKTPCEEIWQMWLCVAACEPIVQTSQMLPQGCLKA